MLRSKKLNCVWGVFLILIVSTGSNRADAVSLKSICGAALKGATCLVVAGSMGCSSAPQTREELEAIALETKSDLDTVDLDSHLTSKVDDVRETIHEAIESEIALGDFHAAEIESGVAGSMDLAKAAYDRALVLSTTKLTVEITDILPTNTMPGLKWAWNYRNGHVPIDSINEEGHWHWCSWSDFVPCSNFLNIFVPPFWAWSAPKTAVAGTFDLIMGWTWTGLTQQVEVVADPKYAGQIQERLARLGALPSNYEQHRAHELNGANIQIVMTYHFASPDPEYIVQMQGFLGGDFFVVPGNRQDGTPFESKWNELKAAIEQIGALKDAKSEIVDEAEFGAVQVTIRAKAYLPPDQIMGFFSQHRRYREGEKDKLTIQITPFKEGE